LDETKSNDGLIYKPKLRARQLQMLLNETNTTYVVEQLQSRMLS